MSDRPTLLLEHHLKELKLPTFLGEYGKIAAQCASEGVDYPDYLLRLAELELIDRARTRPPQLRTPLRSLRGICTGTSPSKAHGLPAGTAARRLSDGERRERVPVQSVNAQDRDLNAVVHSAIYISKPLKRARRQELCGRLYY